MGDDMLGDHMPGDYLPGDDMPRGDMPGGDMPGDDMPGGDMPGGRPTVIHCANDRPPRIFALFAFWKKSEKLVKIRVEMQNENACIFLLKTAPALKALPRLGSPGHVRLRVFLLLWLAVWSCPLA